ncbi:hypothetical protein D5086_032093 [Populus alba]|uniref:Uncharacterized protein n=1 Tax=Populus alba TaxID=43335 RepID=A0ACC4AKE9_POPAL
MNVTLCSWIKSLILPFMDLEIGLSLTISWTKSSVLQFYGFWPWPVGLCYLLRTSRIFFCLFLSDIKFHLGSLSPFECGKYRNYPTTKWERTCGSGPQGKTRAGMMPFVMLNSILYNFSRYVRRAANNLSSSSCLQEAACGNGAAHPLRKRVMHGEDRLHRAKLIFGVCRGISRPGG